MMLQKALEESRCEAKPHWSLPSEATQISPTLPWVGYGEDRWAAPRAVLLDLGEEHVVLL